MRSMVESLKNARICWVIAWQQSTLKKHIKDLSSGFGYARIRSTVENLKNARICRIIAWRQSIVKQNLKKFSSGLCTDKKEERKKILKTQEFVL